MQEMASNWLLWNFSNYCSFVTGYSLTHETEKERGLLNLTCLGFLCIRLLINVFSVNPLHQAIDREGSKCYGYQILSKNYTPQGVLIYKLKNYTAGYAIFIHKGLH